MEMTARFITSGLKGTSKIFGSLILSTGFPVRSKTFLVLTMALQPYFPCGEFSDRYVGLDGSEDTEGSRFARRVG